ncbi:uncharacterized protein LOC126370752 [Pectinophora gossypiella]|uniref:uncharacterized protein LOC126370752 n=1 Tax=Pectinophora gossypiella TaxID=13191 RepID=UPI00214EB7CB|nr:uncharacterized protein LOC126370752 [Pectinophora gossypiella]
MSIHKGAYKSSLSGIINVTKDVENGWLLLVTMQKCHDLRNLDTCDFFRTMTVVKDGCQGSGEADVYNAFFQYVTPKMECPIKAGSYKINKFPVFTGDSGLVAVESRISTSVFGYTYRMEGLDTEYDRILCVEAHLMMIYERNHDWLNDMKKDRMSTTILPLVTEPEDEGDRDTDD